MIILLALLGLAVWAVPATIITIARDGYRPIPTVDDYESSRSA